ncbi:PQQ-binding-like beta-propeller repeat protein [Streptomyces sp. NPDC088910]|uniref:outer membrane protein assembly factor BamB family protein n=1 Tax=Streptomyces sp. NPDC088910 TaxID=3365911 RepID=UPI0038236588
MLELLDVVLETVFAEEAPDGVVPVLAQGESDTPILLSNGTGYDFWRWDPRTGEMLWRFAGEDLISTLAVATPTNGDAVVAVATDIGVVRVDAASGRPVPVGAMAEFDDTAWDVTSGPLPGGRAFIAVAAQCEPFIHYWDATTGEALSPQLTGPDYPLKTITSLSLKDGTVLIAAEDEAGVVYRWVASTGEPFGSHIHGFGEYNMRMTALTHPDGRAVLASLDMNGNLSRYNGVTGEPLGPALSMGSDVGAIAAGCLNESALLFVSSGAGPVHILDAFTGEAAYAPIPGNNPAVLECSDGAILLATVHASDDYATVSRLTHPSG